MSEAIKSQVNYKSKWFVGDIVYHVTDEVHDKGIITSVTFMGSRDCPGVGYQVNWGHACSCYHREYELSGQKIFNN